MKNRYEGLLVLNTKGKEENANDIIERLEGEFKKEGAKVEQVQRMEKRNFSYAAGALDAGYFVNFVFEADPQAIDKLKSKFKLDSDVYRQHYQKLVAKLTKAKKARKIATAKAAARG
jgi:small subunit ribosomal protein S6